MHGARPRGVPNPNFSVVFSQGSHGQDLLLSVLIYDNMQSIAKQRSFSKLWWPEILLEFSPIPEFSLKFL